MKFWVSVILIIIVFVLIRNQRSPEVEVISEVLEGEVVEEPELLENHDSLLRVQALEAALSTFAKGNVFDQDQSTVHYVSGKDGSQAEVRLDYGFIISQAQRHLQLTQQYDAHTEQQYYAIQEGEIKPIGKSKWHTKSEVSLLKDITGDGLKDLVSGESRLWKVRPFDEEQGVFLPAVQLQNPCFSPQEQLVRLYEVMGQDTLFIKMKWDKNVLAPVEYIYPHPDNSFWKLKTTERKDNVSPENAVVLWYLPKEYRSITACAEASVQ